MNVPGPRILIVDDDQALRHFLRIALTAHGYRVLEAGAAGEALATVSSLRPDVIILDLGLPDRHGIEVVRKLREWVQTPILILSVTDQEKDKITALEAGADDYLTKPFSVGELRARIIALLRRSAGARSGAPFRTGDLEIDLTRRVVKVGNMPVSLTPTEYDLLKTLVQAGGKVLTHPQLLRQVWGVQYTNERLLLRVNISALRRKLRAVGGADYIVTESRVGYRLRIDD
jgi:two-component system, OmpR family, KDP operon response regulator KdpE